MDPDWQRYEAFERRHKRRLRRANAVKWSIIAFVLSLGIYAMVINLMAVGVIK